MTLARFVAGAGQTFVGAGFRLSSGALRRQVRHVPTHDEVAQRGDPGVLLELSERVDREQVGRLERRVCALVLRVGDFAARGFPPAVLVLEETEGRSPSTTLPTQPFVDDDGCAGLFIDREMISDEGSPWRLAVLDPYRHRFFGAAGLQFPGFSAAVPGPAQTGVEALGEEGEHVEHGGLAAAVGSEQHGHRRQLPELHVAKDPEIGHLQVLDSRRCAAGLSMTHLVALMVRREDTTRGGGPRAPAGVRAGPDGRSARGPPSGSRLTGSRKGLPGRAGRRRARRGQGARLPTDPPCGGTPRFRASVAANHRRRLPVRRSATPVRAGTRRGDGPSLPAAPAAPSGRPRRPYARRACRCTPAPASAPGRPGSGSCPSRRPRR